MGKINKIYDLNNSTDVFDPDLQYKKNAYSDLRKNMGELFRNSVRREKIYLPTYLRRINLIWEIIVLICISIALISIIGHSIYVYVNDIIVVTDTTASLEINDIQITSEDNTVTSDGRTYIKLDVLCDTLGYVYEKTDNEHLKLSLENKNYYISADSASVDITMADSDEVISNVTLSKKAFIYNDCIYIYVRDLSLFMPVNTSWDEVTKTVKIKSI